jgi:hypothetical protein
MALVHVRCALPRDGMLKLGDRQGYSLCDYRWLLDVLGLVTAVSDVVRRLDPRTRISLYKQGDSLGAKVHTATFPGQGPALGIRIEFTVRYTF